TSSIASRSVPTRRSRVPVRRSARTFAIRSCAHPLGREPAREWARARKPRLAAGSARASRDAAHRTALLRRIMVRLRAGGDAGTRAATGALIRLRHGGNMFDIGKKGTDKGQDMARNDQAPSFNPPSDAPRTSRNIAVIGPSIRIDGDLRGEEDLLIEGEVKGTVQLKEHRLLIGPQGRVKANVVAN